MSMNMFSRRATVAHQQPFIFTPSLEELGFKCCQKMPIHDKSDKVSYNHIYVKNLSNLNKLYYVTGIQANFTENSAGYLVAIDDIHVYNDSSDKSFVTKTFHSAAEKNNTGQLKLTIAIVSSTSSKSQGGTAKDYTANYINVMLPFTDNSTSRVKSLRHSSSLRSSSQVPRPPVSQSKVVPSASSIIQATKSRQSFKQEIIDPNKVYVNILDSAQQPKTVQMTSMFFDSENDPDPTVNFNTSQILSALFFATMLPHTDSTNIAEISSDVQFYSKQYNKYEDIDLSLDLTLTDQRQNIQKLMDTLNDFEIKFIDDVDTSKFMSKKQRDANLVASNSGSGRINSIYMVPDPTGSSQPKKITLLDLLRAAVTQLEKVRTVIGSGGPIDTFARQIQGGSKVNVKNNKQKTRRLHRNGHYNSRKRYD